jgi:tagatose 6-phosphate kinase
MILNAGLSPAWQQILVIDQFREGEVNRARESAWCASGKVLNVGRALKCLLPESTTISTVGGRTGQKIREEFQADEIPAIWVETESPTRVCTTILDQTQSTTTELVEETAAISADELQSFRDAFSEQSSRAKQIVISGSFPPGTPDSLCRELLDTTSATAILDIRGPQLLNALETEPFLVKPNREELAHTLNRQNIEDDELPAAMRTLNEQGAQWVLVTSGGNTIWMTSKSETFRFQPPKAEVVNPIGCGDCLTAGIASGIAQDFSPVEAVQYGISAATMNLKSLLPVRLKRDEIEAEHQSFLASRRMQCGE